MGKTVNQGAGPLKITMIVFLTILFVFVLALIFKAVYPEAWDGIFGKPDDRLVKENQDLKAQLNQTQAELGTAQGQLAAQRNEKVFWTAVIIFAIILIIALIVWAVLYKRSRGLTVEEEEALFGPKARSRYGYPREKYSMLKPVTRVIERVKHKGDQNDELMYVTEFHFIEHGEENLYFHGVLPPIDAVVTVVVLNKTWEYRQRWYPFMNIDEVLKMMHNEEMWGFGLQKTKLEEDILATVETAKNKQEIQEAYTTPESAE